MTTITMHRRELASRASTRREPTEPVTFNTDMNYTTTARLIARSLARASDLLRDARQIMIKV